MKIVDDEEQEVPRGEIGTLLVRGNSAVQQYWRKLEKTRMTMKGEWLNTFTITGNGLFFIEIYISLSK